jgi:hypothetical protein
MVPRRPWARGDERWVRSVREEADDELFELLDRFDLLD